MVITPGSIQKRKVKSNPLLDLHRGTVPFCYVGPLLVHTQPPRWGLSIWPEQDKEQYKQNTAQISDSDSKHSTPVNSSPLVQPPHVVQRLAAKDCIGGYNEPKGRSDRGSTGSGGTAG